MSSDLDDTTLVAVTRAQEVRFPAIHRIVSNGSLRVAVVIFVVITVIFFAVAFLLFLVRLLSKEDIGSYEAIKRV